MKRGNGNAPRLARDANLEHLALFRSRRLSLCLARRWWQFSAGSAGNGDNRFFPAMVTPGWVAPLAVVECRCHVKGDSPQTRPKGTVPFPSRKNSGQSLTAGLLKIHPAVRIFPKLRSIHLTRVLRSNKVVG